MAVADKIVALFAALTREEIAAMPQLHREMFAELCKHWAGVAARLPPRVEGKAGVLGDLQQGHRQE